MDEAEPLHKAETPLDRLSVDEIEARIGALQDEIERCRQELERKRAQKSAADALFGRDG